MKQKETSHWLVFSPASRLDLFIYLFIHSKLLSPLWPPQSRSCSAPCDLAERILASLTHCAFFALTRYISQRILKLPLACIGGVTPCYILGVPRITPPHPLPSPPSRSLRRPSHCLTPSLFALKVSTPSLWPPTIIVIPKGKKINRTEKSPPPAVTFGSVSCFLTHLFDHRKEGAKGAECLLCSSLTRPPLCIHFTLPSEEERQLSVGSRCRNFYREHSRTT